MKSLAVLIFFSAAASAATSGNLIIKGAIASKLSIAISAEAIAMSLPLTTTQTNTKIATVTEQSNSKDGYRVSIASTNLGKLKLNVAHYVPYSLKYDNQAVDLSSGSTFNNSYISGAPIDKDITISYTALSDNAAAGDYTDTITFSIVAI